MFLVCPEPTGRMESPVSDDRMRPDAEKHLWNLFVSDWTLGESSLVVGERRVRSVVQKCVGNQTRPWRVRSLDLGVSGQEYAHAGASR